MAFRDEGGAGLAPALLLEDRGLWRETQSPPGQTLNVTWPALQEALVQAVEHTPPGSNAIDGLVGIAISLTDDLVGPDVMRALEEARAAAEGEPPLLRVHLSPAHEWIPWELLHDGDDFLGLTFRIARLPILPNPPERPHDCTHRVEIVRSLLGKDVAQPEEDDYKTWRSTFVGLLPEGVNADLLPPEQAVLDWPRISALREEADIVHVTCHGMVDEQSQPYWTFNAAGPAMDYRFNAAQFNSVRKAFKKRRPLVFGNACTTTTFTGPNHPPLAKDLFELGALNYIGTLAPVRQNLAVRFARVFYEALLDDGLDVATALLKTKQTCRAHTGWASDPTYLLYCLYGPPEMHYAANGGCGS
jgi:hypothetical protein